MTEPALEIRARTTGFINHFVMKEKVWCVASNSALTLEHSLQAC
jgi:hypothetical protein